MNISYRWLQALAPGLDASPEAVAERLAMRGAPVDDIRYLGEALEDIVVGRVLEVWDHPNADRLSLCLVEDGEGEVQVVCGAPNVREGAWYPFAPVDARLPGGMTIRKTKIRGETSRGMLCSERELALGRDHQGILELHGEFEPGVPLVEALGLDDHRLDVEVTPNRPDLLSHLGVAREVAPEGDAGLTLPPVPGASGDGGWEVELHSGPRAVERAGVSVAVEAPDLCSRYLGLVIRDVTVGPSPEWLASRLRAVGARPINNVVDATNYVLHELGQPLHAFDLSRLRGSRIEVRQARVGEPIRTLDGVDRELSQEMLAICDAERPVAVAGVMGGEDSEVGEETSDILLECALFDPSSIRSTRKALGLSTDSSYRFERGVDPDGMIGALRRAARIILATAGGRVDGPALDAHPRPAETLRVPLRLARVERVLGVPLGESEVVDLLRPLGFEVETQGAEVGVTVPGFRSYDVRREIDLIEELARCHGYDRFPEELGPFRPGTVPDDPRFALEDRLRTLLVGRGLFELQTPAFAPSSEGDVALANPISSEESHLRASLLPGLIRRVEHNFGRGEHDVRLFEIGTVFRSAGRGELPREATHLGVVLTGRRAPEHWSEAGRPVDLWEIKGLFEELLDALGGDEARSRLEAAEASAWFAPESCFGVGGGQVSGSAGRIRDDAIDAPAWADDVWAMELRLPEARGREEPVRFEPLPTHPGVERDLALLIPRDRQAGEVARYLEAEGGDLLREVSVFDVYEGEEIPAGTRSVAYRLLFRAPDRTLTDEEVDRQIDRLTARVEEVFDARLRGG